jgi:ketosteroid isomerase-like protein
MIEPATLLLALASATPAVADPAHGNQATIAKAQEYLAAYSRMDLKALEALYAEEAVFNDPTSTDVPGIGGPFAWHGRQEVLAHIGEWRKSIQSLNYDVERTYEASGHVVFVGEVRPLVATPEGLVQYAYPIVTVVSLANGRVIEHRDYTDYAAARIVPAPAHQDVKPR